MLKVNGKINKNKLRMKKKHKIIKKSEDDNNCDADAVTARPTIRTVPVVIVDNEEQKEEKLGKSIKKRKRKPKKARIEQTGTQKEETSELKPTLPGMSSFFNAPEVEESSSEDEIEDDSKVKKKKKLSRAERAEKARAEEEKLCKIEEELADTTKTPQSAAQFNRLLANQPNSSKLWIQYVSFHISLSELDKARAVIKRALDLINKIEEQEVFNIWVAYLHIENMYGTKETFDNVFDEALRCNDSLKIYLRTIEMLAQAGKTREMEDKIKKVRSKFRDSFEMWETIGRVYYSLNNYREARNWKDIAIKTVQNKKMQLNLIVRFAIMEFRYGEKEAGETLFETILQSDPRKVNIWLTYIDQLVKKDDIDLARKVFERSTCQVLPIKAMKTLFMRWKDFETRYGTIENLQEVKNRAVRFVDNVK